MLTTQLKWALVVVVLLLWGTWIVVGRHLDEEETRINRKHQELRGPSVAARRTEESEQINRFKRESDALKAAGDNEARERTSRLAAEFDEALGGRMQWAMKNPDFDIKGMLRAAALACLPPGAEAEVTVDRFTDFSVRITMREQASRSNLAGILGQFLGQCAAHVYSVRIKTLTDAEILIDREMIEKVKDWETEGIRFLNALH